MILPIFLTDGPAGNPACGDVWKAENGMFILVDYADPFQVGITTGNGERHGFNYREGFARWLHSQKAQYVKRHQWPWAADDKTHPTLEEAVALAHC